MKDRLPKARPGRRAGLSLLILAGAALCGCPSGHLYNKAEHDLAIKAEKTFSEAGLLEGLKGEYALMDRMLGNELQIVRRHTLARRDAWLVKLVGDPDKVGGEYKDNNWRLLEDEIQARTALDQIKDFMS